MRLQNSFKIDECSVPENMTLSEYRRSNAARRRSWRERASLVRRRRRTAQR